ncbi:ubiquinol-cytochrome c reductase cytochrome c1 subunit [Novosphingobium kunmingense]|uniref:Cytochrome c1 n=1 Tax=Novosphingobium kunmingense TaxID=1211806 RepID=A0A2N0H5B9_9SPHN|nr:cytochrome c1 [Novosphingobium kunmingense]PKB14135.1 ubiquinol-cytochrome c reductase cytochrome c1 subunit [Novosphingobium kunmingense]
MIRIFSILAGLFFAGALAWSLLWDTIGFAQEGLPKTVEKAFYEHPKELHLASDGWFGKFDKKQVKRGFEVYQQVCASCHSLKHVSFRDLAALEYSEAEIKELAAAATVNAPDPLTGEMKDRPGLPADHFPPVVYAGQGHPPDLSLLAKARHDGAAYTYSLLTGYQAQPAELLKQFPDAKTPEGLHYNPYFPNLNLAMPAPLTSDGQVTYSDGTNATIDQMAKDVSAFLVWTAEPKLDKRHQVGFWWLGFLIYATILGYLAYRNVWAGKKH